jgi:hypothetical protein
MLSDLPNVVCLRETGKAGRAGVVTTQERKMQFVSVLERLMAEEAITVTERLVSDDADEALKTLKKQLLNYRKVNSEIGKTTAFGMQKITYSGKVSEDGKMAHALQDDLCITLQLLAFWSSYVLQRKCKFLDYHKLFA